MDKADATKSSVRKGYLYIKMKMFEKVEGPFIAFVRCIDLIDDREEEEHILLATFAERFVWALEAVII